MVPPSNRRCDNCHLLTTNKLTSCYARWYPEGEESLGYRLRLCDACVESFLLPAVKAVYAFSFQDSSCPACQDPNVAYWNYTWATSYARKEEPLRFTLVACDDCTMVFRKSFRDQGQRLDDRPLAPADAKPGYWASLGIDPQTVS